MNFVLTNSECQTICPYPPVTHFFRVWSGTVPNLPSIHGDKTAGLPFLCLATVYIKPFSLQHFDYRHKSSIYCAYLIVSNSLNSLLRTTNILSGIEARRGDGQTFATTTTTPTYAYAVSKKLINETSQNCHGNYWMTVIFAIGKGGNTGIMQYYQYT